MVFYVWWLYLCWKDLYIGSEKNVQPLEKVNLFKYKYWILSKILIMIVLVNDNDVLFKVSLAVIRIVMKTLAKASWVLPHLSESWMIPSLTIFLWYWRLPRETTERRSANFMDCVINDKKHLITTFDDWC